MEPQWLWRIFWSELVGVCFVSVAGTLLHFLYKWSGHKRLVGLMAAVNESTWEHLKLLFFPMLFYTIIQYALWGRMLSSFLFAKSMGILAGVFVIVAVFYTYTGIWGANFLPLDIATFFVGVFLGFGVSTRMMVGGMFQEKGFQVAGILLLMAECIAFLLCTRYPPHIGLFCDPGSGNYGYPPKQKK